MCNLKVEDLSCVSEHLPRFRFHATCWTFLCTKRAVAHVANLCTCTRSCLMLSGLFSLACAELPSLPVGAIVNIAKLRLNISRIRMFNIGNLQKLWKHSFGINFIGSIKAVKCNLFCFCSQQLNIFWCEWTFRSAMKNINKSRCD